ncbi:unnamed protein product [Ceratitis capitata]|uniref:(Mediterranean fruit fly) hypothetical protein n=1 Tax=Ceratitis capitata TaxID=7213 RepID=A0A811UDK3_CERCA|nr:unnamed protein product [Ceratitis capitata]
MRYQSWKHFLNSKVHRMRNKFTNWFGLNSPLPSIYNGARRKATGPRLRQFQKQKFSKTTLPHTKQSIPKREQSNSSLNVMVSSSEMETSTDKINELMELSHQHDMLRTEQIQLETQIQKQIAVLIKAVHRHRSGTKKLQELEKLISEYIAEVQAPFGDCTKGSNDCCASKSETVLVPAARKRVERKVGGHEKSSDFYYDFMPVLVKRYAAIRTLARRWMEKAHVKRRRSSPLDIYSAVSLQPRTSLERMVKPAFTETFTTPGARKSQPQVKELSTDEQIERDMQEMKRQTALDEGKKLTTSLRSLLSGEELRKSAESAGKESTSKRGKARNRLKSKESATSDIDKVAASPRFGKRKGRKRRTSRKSVQSGTSDATRQGQKGRIRKKTLRRSRKSIASAERDTSVRRRSQSRRKVKKRASKSSKRSRRSSSQKSVDAIDVPARERKESVTESSGKASQITNKAEKSLETMLADIDKGDMVERKPKRKSAQSVTSTGETVGRKYKLRDMEVKPEEFHDEYSALEQYWGVPLRDDYKLKKLMELNSLLDDLMVEEERKPVPKRALPSRQMSTKPSKRELSDLQKLFILFKECQECQKKQQEEDMLINERKCAVKRQKDYYNTIRNAAGMPDCLPDDSDCSFACSCNSFV